MKNRKECEFVKECCEENKLEVKYSRIEVLDVKLNEQGELKSVLYKDRFGVIYKAFVDIHGTKFVKRKV